ncbi:MAG TPA: hypothetical protein VFO33_04475 [Casimicrobiaceae bacterium]|nr:hypothetical protein [Casimicrobiaceae bacterium]
MTAAPTDESVMKGGGYYSAHSAVQHASAAPGYPMFERAAAEVPLPRNGDALTIGDFGCAGGANEMTPLSLAIGALRKRTPALPIEVVLADLPGNDWTSLFARVETSSQSYAWQQGAIYSYGAGRSLYGPVVPDRRLTLGWTAITVHWLSAVPPCQPDSAYANLVTGPARDALAQRSRDDWRAFLAERARELISGGQLVIVGGASDSDGVSGAEGLFRMVDAELRDLTDRGVLRPSERAHIFYPTWNRTPAEFIGPLAGSAFTLAEQREDVSDDSERYPQFVRDGDATAFAAAYIGFVRAVTEPAFFRWIEADRTPTQKSAIVGAFYAGLERRIAADPAGATCHWHTVTLRLIRC